MEHSIIKVFQLEAEQENGLQLLNDDIDQFVTDTGRGLEKYEKVVGVSASVGGDNLVAVTIQIKSE